MTESDSGLIKIRDAAILRFARSGFAGTTVRAIAADAGVSAALIMHHFGTKDGLIRHCDEHVLTQIERLRADYLRGHTKIDSVTGYLAGRPELTTMTRYLGQALLAGGEPSRRLFDRMIDTVRSTLATGIEVGRIRALDDLDTYAAVLASWHAASIMLGDALAARLGGTDLLDPVVVERLHVVVQDIQARGILTSRAEAKGDLS